MVKFCEAFDTHCHGIVVKRIYRKRVLLHVASAVTSNLVRQPGDSRQSGLS